MLSPQSLEVQVWGGPLASPLTLSTGFGAPVAWGHRLWVPRARVAVWGTGSGPLWKRGGAAWLWASALGSCVIGRTGFGFLCDRGPRLWALAPGRKGPFACQSHGPRGLRGLCPRDGPPGRRKAPIPTPIPQPRETAPRHNRRRSSGYCTCAQDGSAQRRKSHGPKRPEVPFCRKKMRHEDDDWQAPDTRGGVSTPPQSFP